MKTHLKILLVVSCLLFVFCITTPLFAAYDYILLAPDVPFLPNDYAKSSFGSYLQGLFSLGLGIAVTLTILILVYNGIRYMISDIAGNKEDAKKWSWDAILGLLLAFSSWLILSTINENLVDFNLTKTIEEARQRILNQPPKSGTPTTDPAEACTNCVAVPETLPVQAACGANCKLEAGFVNKLVGLDAILDDANIPWAITEAWPPSSTRHSNPCHQSGTCVDANFRGSSQFSPSGKDINDFAAACASSGMSRVEYEVETQTKKNALVRDGANPALIRVMGVGRISAPHFSVYD